MGKVIIIYGILAVAIFASAIYYGWLEIIALVFAILALFPIVTSFLAYYFLAPKLHYEISQKATKQEDENIYEMMMFLECKRGSIILKKMYTSGGNNEITPIKHSASGAEFNYLVTVEDTGSILTADFGISNRPLPLNMKHVFPLSFKSSEFLDSIPIRIVLDVGIDPMKLGVISVIPVNFNYRYVAIINVDYSESISQEGRFKRPFI